jgi:hypothetical protein
LHLHLQPPLLLLLLLYLQVIAAVSPAAIGVETRCCSVRKISTTEDFLPPQQLWLR